MTTTTKSIASVALNGDGGIMEFEEFFVRHQEQLSNAMMEPVAVVFFTHCRSDKIKRTRNYDELDLQHDFLTGFLVNLDGLIVWVTTGHSIGYLQRIRNDGRTIIRARIIDGYCNPSDVGDGVPIDLESRLASQAGYCAVDSIEGDLAMFALSSIEYAPLLAAGKRPLEVASCADGTESFAGFLLAGSPAEHFHHEPALVGQDYAVRLTGTLIPVLPLLGPVMPPDGEVVGDNFFVADIATLKCVSEDGKPAPLTDITGMSGGAVVGVILEEEGFRLVLVGVQSAWWKGYKKVKVMKVAGLIRSLCDAARKSEAG